MRVTIDPLTIAANPFGASGVHGAPLPTVTTTSLVAPLTPDEFFARTRTKYVPAGTPATVNDVAVFPVSKLVMSAKKDDEPASTTYDAAGSVPVGASHVSVTVLPLTDDVKPEGGDGAFAAAWTSPATVREQRLLSEAKIPALLAVKQFQVVTTLPATPIPVIIDAVEPVTIGSAVVGALGVPALQLQSVIASAIAATVRARSAAEIEIRNLCLSR